MGDYLVRGLRAAGIERAALDLLSRASAGVPRSVRLLARAAWLAAASAGAQRMGLDAAQHAIEQVPGAGGLSRAPEAP